MLSFSFDFTVCTFYSDFQGNDEVLQGTRGQPVGADIETNEKVNK